MRRLSKTAPSSIRLAVLISIASCSFGGKIGVPDPQRAIIGKWKEINGSTNIQFFETGTLIQIEPKFHSKTPTDPRKEIRFTITDNQLILSDSEGTRTFQRQN